MLQASEKYSVRLPHQCYSAFGGFRVKRALGSINVVHWRAGSLHQRPRSYLTEGIAVALHGPGKHELAGWRLSVSAPCADRERPERPESWNIVCLFFFFVHWFVLRKYCTSAVNWCGARKKRGFDSYLSQFYTWKFETAFQWQNKKINEYKLTPTWYCRSW